MSFMREPNAEPLPGYRLIEPLGQGGFGEVWKCEAPGGLFKAMKFVYGNLNACDVAGKRAEQELKALNHIKEVRHPFVLSLERLEVVDGELVIVMELADKSLHDYFVECRDAGRSGIPRDTLLHFLRDAAEALDHMQEKHGLQHLDVKPRNLFLVSDRVKVADFGLVKHLELHSMAGNQGALTPLYGAPETYTGKITGTTDQYSLAIVYQELLTGQRPFDGKNPRQLAQQHMTGEPELRWLPDAERAVVARALSKDPAKRFPNCMAFIRALHHAVVASRAESALPRPDGDAIPARGMDSMQFDSIPEPSVLPPQSDDEADLGVSPPAAGQPMSQVSELGMTIAQPETGALRPTVVIGLGSFGRQALLELRCRLLDRFGDLSKLPLLRFLYLESDPDSARNSLKGDSGITFKAHEICHLPLQSVAHYRRRQLEQLTDWLPREKLYTVPRSLKTQGSRALGRLACTGNYLRLRTRLKQEIQKAIHPDSLFQSVNATGLALRNSNPRIYVIASALGGSSGYAIDLAYTLRWLTDQLRLQESSLTGFLYCAAPDDPATAPNEQANLYATLAEFNHYHDPTVSFSAQYGLDGPKLSDSRSPFDALYLLAMPHRSREGRRDVLARLSNYLFHEVTTPLGLRLEACRQQPQTEAASPFRSFGTYSVWFPRGLLVRHAARQASLSLLAQWQATDEAQISAEIQATCSCLLADHGVRPESLAARIEETTAKFLEARPADVLSRILSNLQDAATLPVAHDDPGTWSRQAVARIKELFGQNSAVDAADDCQLFGARKSKYVRALQQAVVQVAEDWSNHLALGAFQLSDFPGRRLSAIEAALQQMRIFFEEQKHVHHVQYEEQSARVQQANAQLEQSMQAASQLQGSGWFFYGSRTSRTLRILVDHLAAFARQCLAEDIHAAVHHCLTLICSRLNDKVGDMQFCRQRLRNLSESIESGVLDVDSYADSAHDEEGDDAHAAVGRETYWESVHRMRTAKLILPSGEKSLDHAAEQFLQGMTAEQWQQLDQAIGEQVLQPLGGLATICLNKGNILRQFAMPVLDHVAALLETHLPVTDVAQALGADRPEASEELKAQIQGFYFQAAPMISGDSPSGETTFLLMPPSEAGKSFAAQTKEVIEGIQTVPAPEQADLMFCREQGNMTTAALHDLLEPLHTAYDDLANNPQTSPHARFDIGDWAPLYV